MSKFSRVAVNVINRCRNSGLNVEDEWDNQCAIVFNSSSSSSANKPCPRNTFLGLCDAGHIVGIPSGNRISNSNVNKRYALEAVKLLKADPTYSSCTLERLWSKVLENLKLGTNKVQNQQMSIVRDLWEQGLIR